MDVARVDGDFLGENPLAMAHNVAYRVLGHRGNAI